MIEPLSEVPFIESQVESDISRSDKTPELQIEETLDADLSAGVSLHLNQESLIQPEEFVAAPVQEISCAANSDAAT